MRTLLEHQDFLLKRASQNELYMAHSLMTFVRKNEMQLVDLQDELACDSDSFLKFALCRRLTFSDSNFQQGVQQIADYTGIDAVKIALLLKRVAMQSSFSQVHKGSAMPSHSFIAAAREKDGPIDPAQLPDEK